MKSMYRAVLGAFATRALAAASAARAENMPTVRLLVGGIDEQIYLPYRLAQNLGFYTKYGVNVGLSTEQQGGVGAEDAVISGQVDTRRSPSTPLTPLTRSSTSASS